MKNGTIFKNLWTGHETYFVFLGYTRQYAHGIKVVIVADEPRISKAYFYKSDIRDDREHFPIVGHVDVQPLLINAILKAVSSEEEKGSDET